jgi:hypothetical protein
MELKWDLENAEGLLIAGGVLWVVDFLFFGNFDFIIESLISVVFLVLHFVIALGIYLRKAWALKAATWVSIVMIIIGLLALALPLLFIYGLLIYILRKQEVKEALNKSNTPA